MTQPIFQPGESIEVQRADGCGLRVTFIRRDDRVAHVVTLLDATGEHTLLESLEGAPEDPWPASPAFQQLSIEGEGTRRVALLVGMAGRSHWSMSVEATESPIGLVFDAACRLNELPQQLGSSYLNQVFLSGQAASASGNIGAHHLTLTLDSSLPTQTQSVAITSDRLTVQSHDSGAATPYTARWKYRLSLV